MRMWADLSFKSLTATVYGCPMVYESMHDKEKLENCNIQDSPTYSIDACIYLY